MPSFACRLTNRISAEAGGVEFESVEVPICQNLIDLSWDDEMREEENTREVILVVWPKNVSMRQGSKLVISQM